MEQNQEKIDKEQDAKWVLKNMNEQLTRLQKGIDKPRAVFKKLGKGHYTVKFEV